MTPGQLVAVLQQMFPRSISSRYDETLGTERVSVHAHNIAGSFPLDFKIEGGHFVGIAPDYGREVPGYPEDKIGSRLNVDEFQKLVTHYATSFS